MELMNLFAAAGVRVVPVEDFDYQAAMVPDLGILLIAADLTSEEREQIVCEYLPEAFSDQLR
jgi:hypothetical protein